MGTPFHLVAPLIFNVSGGAGSWPARVRASLAEIRGCGGKAVLPGGPRKTLVLGNRRGEG